MTKNELLFRELQAEIERSLAADSSVPGIAATISIPRRGIEWSGACGRANRDEDERLSAKHAFRIASVTKVFVAATALRLIEQGLLDLFAPVSELLGATACQVLEGAGYVMKEVTLHQLLTHTSGLVDHAADTRYVDLVSAEPDHRWTRQEQIEFAASLGRPIAVPGIRFSYSDTGYLLVAEILERASGTRLPELIRSQLNFTRLGLVETHFERLEPAPLGQRRTRQYLGAMDATKLDPSCDLYGGGGLISTTHELTRFFRALLRGEIFDHPQTLSAALMTPTVTFAPGEFLHSCLLRGRTLGGQACWAHGGFWGVMAAYLPVSDVALAVTYNQAQAAATTRGSLGVLGVADRLALVVRRWLDGQRSLGRASSGDAAL